MIKKPGFLARQTAYKRIFLLEDLPAPLTRTDEHWQIFDDYTAWPEFRLRQIRVPQTREWFRFKEKIEAMNGEDFVTEKVLREFIPGDGSPADGMHPEKEIRKNRYFYEGSGLAIDVFLGNLWGLILAETSFAGEDEAAKFSAPEFSAMDVSGNEFFRGENLVQVNFEEVKAEFAKVMGSK